MNLAASAPSGAVAPVAVVHDPRPSQQSSDAPSRLTAQQSFERNPNTTVQAPPNSRIFVGNLASERTSEGDLRRIFGGYGEILEVVVRRSFGFVQFSSPPAAVAAIAGEQRRDIGGMAIDLSIADNRGARSKEERQSGRREEPRSRRRRSPSPPRRDDRSRDRRGGDRGRAPKALILFLSKDLAPYADHIGDSLCRDAMLRPDEIEASHEPPHAIRDEVQRAERSGVKYCLVADQTDEQRRACRLTIFRPGVAPDVTDDCPVRDATYLVRQEELFCEHHSQVDKGLASASDVLARLGLAAGAPVAAVGGLLGQPLGVPAATGATPAAAAPATTGLDMNQVLQLLAAANANASAVSGSAQQVLPQVQQPMMGIPVQQPMAQGYPPQMQQQYAANPMQQPMPQAVMPQQPPQQNPGGSMGGAGPSTGGDSIQSLLAKLQNKSAPGAAGAPGVQGGAAPPVPYDPRRSQY